MNNTNLQNKLSFLATAIGSLPHNNPQEAMDLIFAKFPDFPIWPQLANVNPKEDMIAQFTQNIPGILFDEKDNRWYMDQNTDDFYEKLEEFYLDYESIISGENLDLLDKYGINDEFSSTIPIYLEKIKKSKPLMVKGQITGPFTYGTSFVDTEKRCAFYDDTLREILIKGLTLKALWQVKKFQEASPESIPVIFMDEPSISQYGTSAFVTISKKDIVNSISEIAKILKDNGALVAIHCCGKTDWSIILESGVDILNFDGFYFAESLSLYSEKVKEFLEKGGYIAWGMIPTMDEDSLKDSSQESLIEKFNKAKSYLINKGIDEELINNSSFITPACGAGGLSKDLAEKAMDLTCKLSQYFRSK